MTCSACGHENRPAAKFCEECAAALKRICAACGAELRPSAKFCDECAAPVATSAAVESAGARKVVTIVFADLVGSTALHERLDAESAGTFMERYYGAMRAAVETHGGTVTQLLGDGVKAVFGIPRVAEDDAIRAVRAAVEMQRAFRELAELQQIAVGKTGLRVAVNTGEVVANDDTEIIGDPVNVAARLQEQGRDGDVVIGESTRALVAALVTLAPLGSFALKGRAEAVSAYRVESLERPGSAAATAFVGRDDELARIAAVYDAARAAPGARLAVLLGSPGLGKSRLVDEFVRRLGDTATIVRAQCDAAGGASLAPIADALRALPAIDDAIPAGDAERARIVDGIRALLAGSPASPEETFFVVRRLLSALAAARPLVLVVDDLHWAEPLLLDLLEHLVQWLRGAPLLVIACARPELRDARSSLATPGGVVAEVVTLAGLDAGAATRLAANVIGAADLPAAVAAKVLATSEGNPLFVGELVRMLVHEGALRQEGGRWITGTALAQIEMPPTIQALLAARIERLRPEDRAVLERAAVVGRSFSRSAVAELLPREIGDLDARLESLRRNELIDPDTGWFLGEPALRFHHLLIRDAAYRRLLKGTRAELHGRFAGWIESRAGDSIEHDETVGWHLEQAHQLLRELGPLDARGKSIGERATRLLAAAGRRALARDDLPLAAGLLGRALARLDEDDPARAELALDWCEALLSAGDVGPAAAAIDELARFTGDSERLRAWHTCFKGQLATLTAPQALHASVEAVRAAAESLARLGDAAGEAKAHFVHAQAYGRLGKVGACEAALDRALAAARRAGDRRRANAVLAGAPLAALWGPSPVTRASGRCLDVVRVLRISQEAPAVEAVALSCQGVLEALRGRTDAARRMVASSRKMVEELGITHRLLEADVFGARIDLLEGDPVSAERGARSAYEGLRELGLGSDAAQAAALLARALLAQGKDSEAESLSHESETLAGDDFRAAIAWRGVRAEALARRGEHAAAIELAEAAVAIAAATDALLDHADARLALAAALRAAGRHGDADAEERRAIELWVAKGATLLAERARRDVEHAAPVSEASDAQTQRSGSVRRRVRPNAATANTARLGDAVAARDLAAISDLVAADYECVHHPTGKLLARETPLTIYGTLLRGANPTLSNEPLATLGDSLALVRQVRSMSSFVDGESIDVGASVIDDMVLVEVNALGQSRRVEVFAGDRLGDAMARLYERYAELVSEGAERTRAAATARSIATLVQIRMADPESFRAVLAPDVEQVDRRTAGMGTRQGAEAFLSANAALIQLAEDLTQRIDDILDLRPDAGLVRVTISGTDRATRGAFERPYLLILCLGPDGLVTRWEQLDVDREREALARFDALTAAPVRRNELRRGVRANSATRNMERAAAAMSARDLDALASTLSDQLEVVHHPTGVTFGRGELMDAIRGLLSAEHLVHTSETLATLGDRLQLSRHSMSVGGIGGGDHPSFGPSELTSFHLLQVDARGAFVHGEIFADSHLYDAIARLYELHAELLPEGPARARAQAIARSFATALTGLATQDLDALCAQFSATIEFVDHRVLGFAPLRGIAAARDLIRSRFETSGTVDFRVDDVIHPTEDALVMRWTLSGTARIGGGDFVAQFLVFQVFDADGLIGRLEYFDVDREADALTRIEELTAESAKPRPVRRRVRQNSATALWARFDAAIVARDDDALADCFRDSFETTDHSTGTTYGRDGVLDSLRRLLRSRDAGLRHEVLATLGESLVLARRLISASGTGAGRFDVGAYERQVISINDVDDGGRFQRSEVFASDRLGDAMLRLYERYAEQQPEGAARDRAEATSRSVSNMLPTRDLERRAAAFAPEIEFVDHRTVGVGSVHGTEAVVRNIRAIRDLTETWEVRVEDVLELRSDSLLVRQTTSGILRTGGGAFERNLLQLLTFGPDGRVTRWEQSEGDRVDEMLARFDALSRLAPASPFENTAASAMHAFERCWHARDWAGARATYHDAHQMDDRRRLIRLSVSGEDFFKNERVLFDETTSEWRSELVATRGERLALLRVIFTATVDDSGPMDVEMLDLVEVDASGLRTALVVFDTDDLDAAQAELDARFEAGEAARHPRALATLQAHRRAWTGRDWSAWAACQAPGFEFIDHRPLSLGAAVRNSAELAGALRALVELAPDVKRRYDHVRVSRCGFLTHITQAGTREGGAFESVFVSVNAVDEQGRILRNDAFDVDHIGQALARFEAIGADSPAHPEPFANAATRMFGRLMASWSSRDWESYGRLLSREYRMSDRRRMVLLELDREGAIAHTRLLGEMVNKHFELTLLATRGDRLSLSLGQLRVADGDIGPSEIEGLVLTETNEHGEIVAQARFDTEDLDAAYAELDARFAAGEAAQHPRVLATMRAFDRGWARRDWAALVALCGPDFVHQDHRMLGFGVLFREPAEWIRTQQALAELAPDARGRLHHVRLSERGSLAELTVHGTRDGGAFEMRQLVVRELDAEGRMKRQDVFDSEQVDQALARFEAIGADGTGGLRNPLSIPPNAAARTSDRLQAARMARDMAAHRALAARDFIWEDRGRRALLSGDVEMWIDSTQFNWAQPGFRSESELIGTVGDRLVLERTTWTGGSEGTSFENVRIRLIEVDAAGLCRALILYDVEDRSEAFAEAQRRFLVGEAAGVASQVAIAAVQAAFSTRDWAGMREQLAREAIFEDHRLLGLGVLSIDAWIESLRALTELAPDVQVEALCTLCWNHRGRVEMHRGFGTSLGGGPYENRVILLNLSDGERILRLECFDIGDAERAIARFEQLCGPRAEPS